MEIYYRDLELEFEGNAFDSSYWYPKEVKTDWYYEADDEDVSDLLYDIIIDLPENNLELDELKEYIEDNFDDLCEKYMDKIKEHFKEYAIEDAYENYEE